MWYFGVIYNTAVGVKTVVNNTDYPVRFFSDDGSKSSIKFKKSNGDVLF